MDNAHLVLNVLTYSTSGQEGQAKVKVVVHFLQLTTTPRETGNDI